VTSHFSDMQAIHDAVRQFVHERNWQSYHTPKNLSMSIAIEAAELMEIFQWMTADESCTITDPAVREHIAEEIADVMTYCISMANTFGFDMGEIIADKMKKNARKYPPPTPHTEKQ